MRKASYRTLCACTLLLLGVSSARAAGWEYDLNAFWTQPFSIVGQLLIAYLMGSLPFGLLIAKTFCGIDPRLAGSGNVGSTNVARLCGVKWGVLTLVCDALKGALPVAVSLWLTRAYDLGASFFFTDVQASGCPNCLACSYYIASGVALAALLGHLYSIFLRFKGGKAVATTVGVFIPLAFLPLLAAGIVCILVIWRSGFVSLGSLTLVTLIPLALLAFGRWELLPFALLVAALVYFKHRENIRRLLRGEEKPWLKKK